MKIIEYFLHNKRLNYVLLFFLLFLGMNAYQNIPKELFPEIALDKISITGAYSGASAENLDKMAVRDIEDELGDINGVESIETAQVIFRSRSILKTVQIKVMHWTKPKMR